MGSNRKAFQRQTRGQCYKETERLEVTEIVQLVALTHPTWEFWELMVARTCEQCLGSDSKPI